MICVDVKIMNCMKPLEVGQSSIHQSLCLIVMYHPSIIIHAKNVEQSILLGTNDCSIASSQIIVSLLVTDMAKSY